MLALIDHLTSPPAQTFHVLQPTSSTITYTVSTRPVPKTLPALARYYAGILLRVSLGIISILSLWSKFCVTNEARYDPTLRMWKMGHGVEAHLVRLTEACQWRYLIPTACIMLFLVFRRNYTEESLTILRGLGVQTSTTSLTYLQTPTTRFIPTTSIQDVFIHEAFKGFEVKFYLMVVVEEEEKVVVVFPRLLPRRETLEIVWRGVRGGLWEDGVRSVEWEKRVKGKAEQIIA